MNTIENKNNENTNTIIHYLQEQNNRFNINLILAVKDKHPDAFHDLRVAVKRLRAMFYFMEAVSQRQFNATKAFYVYRKIFKRAGIIRDFQLQIEFIQNQNSTEFSEYVVFLNEKVTIANEAFIKSIDQFKFSKPNKLENQIAQIIQSYSPNDIRQMVLFYIQNAFNLVNLIQKNNTTIERWHKIRSQLKLIQYIMEFMSIHFEIPSKIKELFDEIKLFTESIGNWHDDYQSAKHLERFLEQVKLEPQRKEGYDKLLHQIRNRIKAHGKA